MRRVKKKMQKTENFLKGILKLYKCVKVFSPKVKSCLGGEKGKKMKKGEKDMNRAIQHNGGRVSGNRGDSYPKRPSSFVLTAISVVSVFVTVALLMTGTVEAQVAPNPTFVTVNVSPPNPPTIPADQITIGWSTGQVQKGSHSIHVTTIASTPDYAMMGVPSVPTDFMTPDYAMVGVPTDFTLQSATQISYWGYTSSSSSVNAPDEIFLFLDTDNDGEVDVILGNHWGPSGTGSWQQWNMTKGSWFTADPDTGVTTPANISDYCDKGYKVLGVAIGAGSPESYPTGVTVDVYLDNLTIDVDGDGNPEYTLDDDTGTIEVFCETINGTTYCASIQDAINAALPGDTILVAAGLYNITKPASEHADILVNKDNLTLRAMNPAATLADPWNPSEASIIVASGNVEDVVNIAADGVTFDGFTVSRKGANVYGINISDFCNNCVVKNNYITNCSYGILAAGDGHNISNNTCVYNGYGIYIYNSDNVTIEDNTCNYNKYYGIIIGGSANVTIEDNTCNSNEVGIVIVESANVTIEDNTCNSNGHGIYLELSRGIVIRFNNISNNTAEDSGVHVESGCEDILISFNNIYGNSPYGVYNDPSNSLVNATNNWWGDVSGPSSVGHGTGDKVSANVDYDPWLDAPYPGGQPINFTGAQTTTTSTGTTEIDAKVNASTTVSINTTAPVNVTIAEYSRNPGSGFSGDIGKYIDVHVDDTTNVTNMTIKLFYTDADIVGLNENTLRMLWWNDATGEWVACSNTGVNTTDQNGYSGYIWAYIDQTTIPSLSDLTGKPFGGQGSSLERVPVLTPIGLLVLISILNVVLAVATMKRKKSK